MCFGVNTFRTLSPKRMNIYLERKGMAIICKRNKTAIQFGGISSTFKPESKLALTVKHPFHKAKDFL